MTASKAGIITYSAKQRRAAATVHTKSGDEKFPIKDKRHASLALGEINSAKPALSPEQKASVRTRAARYGVTDTGKGSDKKSK